MSDDERFDPSKTYTFAEAMDIAIRVGQHAGHRAALDASALQEDRDKPLFLTEHRVREIIREEARAAVDLAREKSTQDIRELLANIGLPVDDKDDVASTRERLRLALSFPSNAKSFSKWLGATIGGAILVTITGFIMAALQWAPGRK